MVNDDNCKVRQTDGNIYYCGFVNNIGDFGGALEDMPHYCVTIGIYEIAHARKIRLGCFRNWHRAVVRRTAYGDATSDFPVSLLTNHPDINLKITEFVAALEG